MCARCGAFQMSSVPAAMRRPAAILVAAVGGRREDALPRNRDIHPGAAVTGVRGQAALWPSAPTVIRSRTSRAAGHVGRRLTSPVVARGGDQQGPGLACGAKLVLVGRAVLVAVDGQQDDLRPPRHRVVASATATTLPLPMAPRGPGCPGSSAPTSTISLDRHRSRPALHTSQASLRNWTIRCHAQDVRLVEVGSEMSGSGRTTPSSRVLMIA
jgi:hypothetical protein